MVETTFDLQFDIVMVRKNLANKFFKLLSFYSFYFSFPMQNNGKIINRGSNSYWCM